MTEEKERKVLLWTSVGTLVLAVVFFALTAALGALDKILEPLFLIALGIACECGIRYLMMTKVPYDNDHTFVTTSGWYQKNRFDKWLIQKDPVRRWADLSKYNPDVFAVVPGQRETTVQRTCTLERMNLVAAVLAFLPLLTILPSGRKATVLIVMLILGVLFCAWDLFSAVRARHYRFQVKAGRV